MDDGPPRFTQDFKCPALLRNVLTAFVSFAYGDITLYVLAFQLSSATNSGLLYARPATPDEHSCSKSYGDVAVFISMFRKSASFTL